jgi:uncharacterized metal-binding protein
MSEEIRKVGIISCSGEAIAEGAISRLATRRVLEVLRPNKTATICLPLFVAGDENDRSFARIHSTIVIDGCAKQCARHGVEQHNGTIAGALVVSDILGAAGSGCSRSSRRGPQSGKEAVLLVADCIANEVDKILSNGH